MGTTKIKPHIGEFFNLFENTPAHQATLHFGDEVTDTHTLSHTHTHTKTSTTDSIFYFIFKQAHFCSEHVSNL